MAVHDPESSLQEKQQALKIGRQKKIQIIDGQRVEVMTGNNITHVIQIERSLEKSRKIYELFTLAYQYEVISLYSYVMNGF